MVLSVEVDRELIEQAMRLYGTRSVEETVELALRRVVGSPVITDEALALEGSGWGGDLDDLRTRSGSGLVIEEAR